MFYDVCNNKFDHKTIMMRTGKILRSKTEKKENKTLLPQLRPAKRLVTLDSAFTPSETRKLSQNLNSIELAKRGKTELKKIIDENFFRVTMGKNTVKFSRKKFNNEFMMVQQINNSFSTPWRPSTPSNVIQYGSDQYQGLRDHNQDRILTGLGVKIFGKSYNIFGVFDGHGGAGPSQFAKNNLIKYFEEQMIENPLLSVLENLRKAFNKLEEKVIEMSKSKLLNGGTCASVLIICQDNYYIGHLGDSRILKVCKLDQNPQTNQLTTDHKPEQRTQKSRIQSVGGKIYRNKTKLPDGTDIVGPYRVLPGRLSVSRTIGDYEAKKLPGGQAVSWQPQLIEGRIEEKCLFLLFTDGAYQKFENNEIAQFFTKSKSFEEIQLKKSMQTFLINSILKQSCDNISLISVAAKPISH